MKTRIYFLISLLGCFAMSVFAQTPVWTQMPGSPSETRRHDDIVFIGETNGWSARGIGGIFKTTDAGRTWVQKLNRPGTHFRCIGFVSKTRGFAGNLGVGSYDGNVTDTNVLYETFDGGETWSVVPGISETGMKGFCAMYVLDEQHIYGGGRVRGPAHFVKSEDGGTTWTVVDLKSAGVMGGIMDVYFKDPLNGFVVGMDTNEFFTSCGGNYHGRIARTTDGGATWTAVADTGLACSYFWKMSWPTPQVGYASLQQNAASSNLIFYKTTDGGSTWVSNGVPYSAIGIPSFSLLQGIGFINENEGWVGGPSGVSANNFLHTTDGGASWTPVGYNDSQQINRIRFYPKFAIASGSKLHIYKIPLAITAQPQNQTNDAGSTALLSVGAQGVEPLTFQWRFNDVNLDGATQSTLSIPNFQSGSAGNYDVIVGDFSGFVTSSVAKLSLAGAATLPVIVEQPRDQVVFLNSNATFSVAASGTPPLSYQWRFNGVSLANATNSSFTLVGAKRQDAGEYSVNVSNAAGTVSSAPAKLMVISTNDALFYDDFDRFASPVTITTAGETNGYRILFSAASGPVDFKAIFGFDYSTVTFPTSIPPAPHSAGGSTKGLFLTVNKDATGAVSAVNLYPLNQFFSGDFSLKFDMWINWADLNTSTEHTLIGINHSGTMTNRIGKSGSDGLFFAVEGEDDTAANSTTLRDYAVFHGGGSGAPVLMTDSQIFGPAPLLASSFDNYAPGFVALFPPQTFPGYGTTPSGTAGLRWISGEIRQRRNLVTWLLNNTIIAQFTNTFGYTNGNILLGYDDNFASIGDSNNFVVLDNIRVDPFVPGEVKLLSPQVTGGNFSFSFATEWGENYVVQRATNLANPNWVTYTNAAGNNATCSIQIPVSDQVTETYFRVLRQ